MDALLFDPFDLCRRAEERAGTIPVAKLPRLAAASAERTGTIQWRLKGGRNRLGQPQLSLSIEGTLKLICQRCLNPFDYELESRSILVLARSEGEADEIEAMLNDDSVEVIVGESEMDMTAMIEDEALLAMPLSPRHEVCPDNPLADRQGGKESPFAVLRGLKKE